MSDLQLGCALCAGSLMFDFTGPLTVGRMHAKRRDRQRADAVLTPSYDVHQCCTQALSWPKTLAGLDGLGSSAARPAGLPRLCMTRPMDIRPPTGVQPRADLL